MNCSEHLLDFVLIVFLINFSGTVADCPDGFEHQGASCYKASGLEASWIEAKLYCRVLGSELSIVESAAEETTVEGVITRLHGAHIDEEYWLSGADINTEGTWEWMSANGQSWNITYSNWGHGAPDNNGGQENCLLINYHGGRTYWNDADCNEHHSFVCEVGFDAHTTSHEHFGG